MYIQQSLNYNLHSEMKKWIIYYCETKPINQLTKENNEQLKTISYTNRLADPNNTRYRFKIIPTNFWAWMSEFGKPSYIIWKINEKDEMS